MYEWLLEQITKVKDNKFIIGILVLAVALFIGLATGVIPQIPVETAVPSNTPTNTLVVNTATLTEVPYTATPTLTLTSTVTPSPTLLPTDTPVPNTATPQVSTGKVWYVAVDGLSTGDGSLENPWDSRTGQWDNDNVKPGDTVCFLEGIYDGVGGVRFVDGTADKPITVRPCDGAEVSIRRGTAIYSDYVIFTGFEIWFPYKERVSSEITSHPTDLEYRSDGVSVLANYVKVINNVIHDQAQGISVNKDSVGAEIYGNIIYNNGWIAPDRGHGHGIYPQNLSTTIPIVIENNVIFRNFGNYNIHVYGETPVLVNYIIKDNITFDGNFLVGGGKAFDQMSLINNYHNGEGYMRLGYSASPINKSILLEGNTVKRIWMLSWNDAVLKDNRFDVFETVLPADVSGSEPYPIMNEVIWQKNKYNGSYFVIIHNPEGKSYITLDVPFDKYTITNIQNMNETQTTNVINMNGFTYLKPIGYDKFLGQKTAPYFLVLLIEEG